MLKAFILHKNSLMYATLFFSRKKFAKIICWGTVAYRKHNLWKPTPILFIKYH